MRLEFFFFQAEDGIRDLVRSRGLGDVYKRQDMDFAIADLYEGVRLFRNDMTTGHWLKVRLKSKNCLLYTSDAADERSSVDLGGRRIIKKKKLIRHRGHADND